MNKGGQCYVLLLLFFVTSIRPPEATKCESCSAQVTNIFADVTTQLVSFSIATITTFRMELEASNGDVARDADMFYQDTSYSTNAMISYSLSIV